VGTPDQLPCAKKSAPSSAMDTAGKASQNKPASRFNSMVPAQADAHRLPCNGIPPHRPANPIASKRESPGVITAKQLQELQHRHQMQLRELKEEKAFLVAQNLRLERELCLQNQPGHGVIVDPRRGAAPKSRPSFNRSRSHPNADLQDPHHSLSSNSPTCSGSSCSSHPWASSGGTNTPCSLSPRSRHSRNPSSTSLAVPASHAPPPMSRRPSCSGTGMPAASAPDPAVLLQRLRLADRQQKLAHLQNVLHPLRPLSVASNACEEVPLMSSRSNPGSRGTSRRNSLTASSNDQPLKGILKPSTPIRPVSSCSNTVVGPPTRPSTGIGYYLDESYDSITRPCGQRTTSSMYSQQLHRPTNSMSSHRDRRASFDMNSARERPRSNHGCTC